MHGSIYEWCSDGYGSYLGGDQTDPTGAQSGSYRVLRGGGWYFSARYCHSADRYRLTPSSRYGNYGFRLVRAMVLSKGEKRK
jgi:sulfatase modifying factor 1